MTVMQKDTAGALLLSGGLNADAGFFCIEITETEAEKTAADPHKI